MNYLYYHRPKCCCSPKVKFLSWVDELEEQYIAYDTIIKRVRFYVSIPLCLQMKVRLVLSCRFTDLREKCKNLVRTTGIISVCKQCVNPNRRECHKILLRKVRLHHQGKRHTMDWPAGWGGWCVRGPRIETRGNHSFALPQFGGREARNEKEG